jgi:hypothetical protein
MSAEHTPEQIDRVLDAFERVSRDMRLGHRRAPAGAELATPASR